MLDYTTCAVIKFTAHDTNDQKYVLVERTSFYKLKDGYQTADEFALATCYKAAKENTHKKGGKRHKSYRNIHRNLRKSKYHNK